MRVIVLATFVQISMLVINVSGQASSDDVWTRVETEKKEVSVTFPSDYIADLKKRSNGQMYRVVGFKNGVFMELKVTKDADPKARLERIDIADSDSSKISKIGKLNAKRFVSTGSLGKYFQKVYAASNEYLFSLNVESAAGDKPEVLRFLGSIKLSNEQIFRPLEKYVNLEKPVSIASLETNPSVIGYLDRKSDKYVGKVTFQPESKFVIPTVAASNVRPAIVLDTQYPRPKVGGFGMTNSTMSCKVVINFLSIGEVGDITVYSDSNIDFKRACAEAAKKTKFIPAWDGNKNVDFIDVQRHELRTALLTTTVVAVPGVRRFP